MSAAATTPHCPAAPLPRRLLTAPLHRCPAAVSSLALGSLELFDASVVPQSGLASLRGLTSLRLGGSSCGVRVFPGALQRLSIGCPTAAPFYRSIAQLTGLSRLELHKTGIPHPDVVALRTAPSLRSLGLDSESLDCIDGFTLFQSGITHLDLCDHPFLPAPRLFHWKHLTSASVSSRDGELIFPGLLPVTGIQSLELSRVRFPDCFSCINLPAGLSSLTLIDCARLPLAVESSLFLGIPHVKITHRTA